ncbi:MAG: membrane-bound alpha-1,6- mannosyltransferase Initiation-specific [Sclerophora amabilis]|nr:MAG: membrane-bound alpha-1,6- mannosyltransferase Initiation-specific [Sclerophora amabilis]
MITFRKGLLVAVCILTFYYLLLPSIRGTPVPSDRESANALGKSPSDSAPKGKVTARPNLNPTSSWKAKPRTQGEGKVAGQQTLQDSRELPLREQLAYQFPYDVGGKFPGYIWQTWKYTPSSRHFEEQYRAAEASWTEHHPGFVHEVITDLVAVPLLKHLYASVPTVLEAYKALPLPILKADFFRYLILLARGGIYTDIDTSALKPAPEWVPQAVPRSSFGLVIGIEADPDRPDWHEWFSRRIQFCQWTIQAKPGHPVLREIVASITEDTLKRKAEGRLAEAVKSIVEFTGPALWTDIVFAYLNNPAYFDMGKSEQNITVENFFNIKEAKKVGDVVVLPITSFSPGIKTMNAGEPEDPMAFVKHDFEGTWKPEVERHIGEIFDENGNQQ